MSKVDQSGFQLDKKELLKETPLMLKAPVGAFIDWIDALDVNHDGKADISQVAPIAIKAMPVIMELAPLIDTSKLKAWLLSHDFINDVKKAEAVLEKLATLAAQVK